MCLYTRQVFPRRAKEDIIVYKVLSVSWLLKELRTPFRKEPVTSEILITEKGKPMKKICWRNIFLKGPDVVEEGIHSYSDYKYAACTPNTVFEAKIPKGALYYKDAYDPEYCSTKLILTGRAYSHDGILLKTHSVLEKIIATNEFKNKYDV